jgi:hypothetical protein
MRPFPRRHDPYVARTLLAILGAVGALGCPQAEALPPVDRSPLEDGAMAMDATGDPLDGAVATLALGAGPSSYAPLEDGDELALHMGIQGGWHVYPAAQGRGVGPEGCVLAYDLLEPDTGESVALSRNILLADNRVLWNDDDSWDRFGDALIISGLDTDVLGRELDLVAVLSEDGSLLLEDFRRVLVVAAE